MSILYAPKEVVLAVKNLPANARDIRDMGLIPGLGRSARREHGNPLQYSYLGNPKDRGAWRAMVHRVAKSQTWLKWLNTHTHTHTHSRRKVREKPPLLRGQWLMEKDWALVPQHGESSLDPFPFRIFFFWNVWLSAGLQHQTPQKIGMLNF